MSRQPNYAEPSLTFSPPLNDREDLTWLDFLRSAGTLPTERPTHGDEHIPADRKRRHTGTEPEGRSYPYPQHSSASIPDRQTHAGLVAASSSLESSRNNVIDLTTSVPPRTSSVVRPALTRVPGSSRSVRSITTGGRRSMDQVVRNRENDVVLPKWQPDSQVSSCPVCNAEFSFWYRKHHCRKCGRVVCATCSPHRITIPRQYIVQPPNPYWDEHDLSTHFDDGEFENPALGGGEVVRVCNPCVPDPWTPPSNESPLRPAAPTPEIGNDVSSTTFPAPLAQPGMEYRQPGQAEYSRHMPPPRPSSTSSPSTFPRSTQLPAPPPPPSLPPPPFHGRHRSQTYQASHSHSRSGRVPRADLEQLLSTHFAQQSRRHTGEGILPGQSNQRRHTHSNSAIVSGTISSSSSSSNHNNPHYIHYNGPLPPIPSAFQLQQQGSPSLQHAGPSSAPPPARRREVKEEDECPVCGLEMPPGEAVRESHIQDCIATRFSSTPSQRPAVPSPPTANSLPSASVTPPSLPTEARPRATSYRPRGMAISRATEKDCTTEDGEPQECVICFEEFQPGDELGRMECLCKFHRVCIRQWWDTKGQGSCPTHQLHD